MSRHFARGDRESIQWDAETEYAEANGGWGMCNTGSGKRMVCCFNGIGCDVDHVSMMMRRAPIGLPSGVFRTARRLGQ